MENKHTYTAIVLAVGVTAMVSYFIAKNKIAKASANAIKTEDGQIGIALALAYMTYKAQNTNGSAEDFMKWLSANTKIV